MQIEPQCPQKSQILYNILIDIVRAHKNFQSFVVFLHLEIHLCKIHILHEKDKYIQIHLGIKPKTLNTLKFGLKDWFSFYKPQQIN